MVCWLKMGRIASLLFVSPFTLCLNTLNKAELYTATLYTAVRHGLTHNCWTAAVPLCLRAFDVELLYIAQCFKIPIAEVAVNWTEIEGRFFMEHVDMCRPSVRLIHDSKYICNRLSAYLSLLVLQRKYCPFSSFAATYCKYSGHIHLLDKSRMSQCSFRQLQNCFSLWLNCCQIIWCNGLHTHEKHWKDTIIQYIWLLLWSMIFFFFN